MKQILRPLVAAIILCTSCAEQGAEYLYSSGSMLGTSYHIKADLPATAEMEAEVEECAKRVDRQMKSEMSIFDPQSQLSRLNSNLTDSLTPALERNIQLADSVSRLSGGFYDITVAPLVKAWGFAIEDDMVDNPNVDSLLQFVGYEGIAIDNHRLVKRDERMQIDLNSIAKGYTVDRMAEELEAMGARNYMIDIGGELRLQGVNPYGEAWRVGIETPFEGNMSDGEYLQRCIALPDSLPLRAIATSGNYRRFYLTADGHKVVHTINPLTGESRPSRLLSATVLAPTCALADAYATMLMAAGDVAAVELAEAIDNCEVYLIFSNHDYSSDNLYSTYFSRGIEGLLLEE